VNRRAALTVLWGGGIAAVAASSRRAAAGTGLAAPDAEATARYVLGLRNADGGFRNTPAAVPSTIQATVSGLRALKYLGTPVPSSAQTAGFVNSLAGPDGSYADGAGLAADVRSTALAWLALADLGFPPRPEAGTPAGATAAFLEKQARALPDVYFAAAAFEAAGTRPQAAEGWIRAYAAAQNPDGSFGKGAADTARGVITLLRLKATVREREGAAKALKSAQQDSGGFAAPGSPADLPTSYPMMRALYLLKAPPNVAALRRFVAACRNPDGGYGAAPGQPSTLSTTYFATILLHWCGELDR
jgi:hypothetical protein